MKQDPNPTDPVNTPQWSNRTFAETVSNYFFGQRRTARKPSKQAPGSRIVWINHFGGFNGPAKVRLLKIIQDEQTSYPFLVGARMAGQRKLGRYRWARVYPSRQSALAAMGGWEAARRKRIHCANVRVSDSPAETSD